MSVTYFNKKGQIFAVEYIIVLGLAAAAILAMTVYFKRTVQARIRDARSGMVDIVRAKVGNTYSGTNVWEQYEPYYANTDTLATKDIKQIVHTMGSPGFSSGVTQTLYNERTNSTTVSVTAPPDEAN